MNEIKELSIKARIWNWLCFWFEYIFATLTERELLTRQLSKLQKEIYIQTDYLSQSKDLIAAAERCLNRDLQQAALLRLQINLLDKTNPNATKSLLTNK